MRTFNFPCYGNCERSSANSRQWLRGFFSSSNCLILDSVESFPIRSNLFTSGQIFDFFRPCWERLAYHFAFFKSLVVISSLTFGAMSENLITKHRLEELRWARAHASSTIRFWNEFSINTFITFRMKDFASQFHLCLRVAEGSWVIAAASFVITWIIKTSVSFLWFHFCGETQTTSHYCRLQKGILSRTERNNVPGQNFQENKSNRLMFAAIKKGKALGLALAFFWSVWHELKI